MQEYGIGAVTVAQLISRARVSRKTFYELFGDFDDCLLGALEHAVERTAAVVVPRYRVAGPWRHRMRSALTALLGFWDAEPALARLCVVEALGAGPRVLRWRATVLRLIIDAVEDGRNDARAVQEPPALAAEGVVGSMFAIVHSRMLSAESGPLLELVNPLMSIVVLPYLGSAVAQDELTREPPSATTRSCAAQRPVSRHPLEDLEIRLTRRTVLVLRAIAAQPGASNRQLAVEAEVADQGQMSRLLMRLQGAGLIVNAAGRRLGGKSNAWRLTAKGQALERATLRYWSS